MSSTTASQAAPGFDGKRQSSIRFAKGTRGNNRESQAWAGMMSGNLSSDDSDSDESDSGKRARAPANSSSAAPIQPTRASWSSRAAAVGSRPPDSASQNPPTLKLLGLQSVREGGAPLGKSGSNQSLSPNRPSAQSSRERATSPAFDMVDARSRHDSSVKNRIISTSDYGDELDRHGSYIEFGGADGFGDSRSSNLNARGYHLEDGPVKAASSSLQPPNQTVQPLSPTTALTHQLGLITPQPLPSPAQSAKTMVQDSYFPPVMHSNASRNLVGDNFIRPQQQNQAAPPRGMAPLFIPPPAAQAISLQRGQPSPGYAGQTSPGYAGQPSPGYAGQPSPGFAPLPSPLPQQQQSQQYANGTMNANQQIPPSMMAGQKRPLGGPVPGPIPLPSPVFAQAGAPRMNHNAPPPFIGNRTGVDSAFSSFSSPGFSDSHQAGGRMQSGRKPSLLRRSMAFISGQTADAQQPSLTAQQQQQPQQQQTRQPQQQQAGGRGLFRRSMAFLSGRPQQMPVPSSSQPQQQQQQRPTDSIALDDEGDQATPRVRGFENEEKPKNRKSEYLGASGVGDEWDYSGNGAKFWKRFSIAQRLESEGRNKDSEKLRLKTEKRRKYVICLSLLGGVIIIGAVVAIIIWRESVTTSAIPGTLDRQENGVESLTSSSGVKLNAATSQSSISSTPVTDSSTADVSETATTKTKKHHDSNNGRRDMIATMNVVEAIKREIEDSPYNGAVHPLPRHQLESQMIRRRKHVGRQSPDAHATPIPHFLV
ncbi:hypothetical protein CBS101457_001105 [Exobasidium rhododendri]|nr:hypothetical protein CBS101457_001105 [Exobasidium rhododendri]